MEAAKERPPYVIFEYRSVEDRAASLKAGHYVGKDVGYAIITPAGSKDRIERVADEWFAQLRENVAQDRFPAEWLDGFERMYKRWKENLETPENGTPIMSWPAISPSQQKAILNANVRTVEDLAVANEATLTAIGMGSRSLQMKARSWLETANDVGKIAERNAALETKQTEQDELIKIQAETISKLTSRLDALETAAAAKK